MFLIKNCIEKRILKPFKVLNTRYHGGDLEENSIRNIIKNGDDIFVKTCICLSKENDKNVLVMQMT